MSTQGEPIPFNETPEYRAWLRERALRIVDGMVYEHATTGRWNASPLTWTVPRSRRRSKQLERFWGMR